MSKASNYIPALRYGNKIHPEDLAGMIGLPYVGNVYYVDPTGGDDTNNGGKSQTDAFATVKAAFDACVSGKHDVVVIAPTGGTGRTTETEAITWNKRFTHLVGSAAPNDTAIRAGMSFGAGLSPALTISENGCIFKNLTIATFQNNNSLVNVTGEYNYFGNVHFQGMGHATAAAATAGRCVTITGAGENTFEGCTFGLDTVTRSAANAALELTGTCARNVLRGCKFLVFTDDQTAVHIKADTGNCYERYLLIEDCLFLNADTASSTTLTTAMDLSATGNGTVVLKDSYSKGATDWSNDFTSVFLTMPLTDTDEGGLMKIGT